MSRHKTEDRTSAPAPEPAPADVPPAATGLGAGGEPGVAPERASAPSAELTAAELEDLRAKAAQARQWHDQWLRAAADLDNYRKRAARERAEAVRYANEGLLQKLVPVLDNFDMAMAAAAGQNTSVQSLQAGIAMIHQQLKAALADGGLEEIDASLKPFDPTLHEAVSQEDSTEVAEGHVLRQLRKGYRLRERLLRAATVVVARAPAAGVASASDPA